jgi:hypothetical protein
LDALRLLLTGGALDAGAPGADGVAPPVGSSDSGGERAAGSVPRLHDGRPTCHPCWQGGAAASASHGGSARNNDKLLSLGLRHTSPPGSMIASVI